MPKEQQVLRDTGVGLLSFARQPETAGQFMDFRASGEARACYEKYGWIAPNVASPI